MLGSKPKFPSASPIFDQISEKVKRSELSGDLAKNLDAGSLHISIEFYREVR